MQIVAIVVSLAFTAVGVTLFARAIAKILSTVRVGQPVSRTDHLGARTRNTLTETLLHTRMLQWTKVGVLHWFIMIGFGLLFATLVNAYGQLFDPHFILPVIGHFPPFEWLTELFAWAMVLSIVPLLVYRATRDKERRRGIEGRFFGSTMWQGYFVEWVILLVGTCILLLRFLEYALAGTEHQSLLHFPLTSWLGQAFTGLSVGTLENLVLLVAMIKIVVSMVWMIVLGLNATMGVAWHRFTAPFNIFFKREPDGRVALGAVKPLTSAGEPVSLDDIEDLDEDASLGVGAVEEFSWKGILDFTTCTECGRCQSQCPAWNTDKPLSPKLLITALRDHAYAKAPYLQAGEEGRTALLEGNDTLTREVERPLVGDTGDDWFYMPENGSAVIDPDVLWSCTTCGACVQQCPVDIEHVDHIVDMRRYQVLVESNFPAELNQLFKGLENKGNPWNMSPSARMDWAKGLDFEVKVVGEDVESLDEVDWLFWVGCAGAYEDRAKKTTRAVAELLDLAGVSFAVLGNGETCNGDPARRAGNEFVFQGLASQNAETFREHKVKKVVSTCAHCFNTLKNEYQQFGVELEVVHHTQLLNRLVREGRLTPVADGAGAAKRSITYHDPCYLGRHNQVYSPPRELLQVLPGAEVKEMPRNSERSFCCGAGGARMWMEENLGERINVNRTVEAVATGADQIAVGCPFCRVMLSDGLTAQQAKGEAREEVEVLDVAQLLLASVRGEAVTKARASGSAPTTSLATAGSAADDEATKAEPEAGDATRTEDTVTTTEDAGPAAKASGGTSLFDVGGEDDDSEDSAREATPDEHTGIRDQMEPRSGGSLFDLGGDEPAEPPIASSHSDGASATGVPDVADPDRSVSDDDARTQSVRSGRRDEPDESAPSGGGTTGATDELTTGGSLFDIAAPEPAPTAGAQDIADVDHTASDGDAGPPSVPGRRPETGARSADLPEGGSLFDIAAPDAVPADTAEADTSEPTAADTPEPGTTTAEDSGLPGGDPGPAAPSGAAVSEAATLGSRDDEAVTGGSTPDAVEETSAPSLRPEAVPEPQDAPDAEDATGEEEPTSTPPDEQSAPKRSTDAAHQPRTDVQIDDSGSLFDL